MADKKISQLTDLTDPAADDVLPIVDVSGTPVTKKVAVSSLMSQAPVQSVAGKTDIVTLSSSDVTGLGSAAVLDPGTGANNLVQLDASSRLPAVDGSQLINLPAGGGGPGAFNTIVQETSDARTLSDGDNGKVIVCTNGNTTTITIPTGLTPGFNCKVIQDTIGLITIDSDSGVTLGLEGGKNFTTRRYQSVNILGIGADTYTLESNDSLQLDPTA